MHKCINNSIGNVYHLEQFVNDFFPYSQKQLGFDKPVTIRFESDQENADVLLGRTAHYDPANMEIVLYIDDRHPKDVLRSLSHELVHHAQNCRGDFQGGCDKTGWHQACVKDTDPGYAQRDPHMRKLEREAYTKGNLIFRDFEDLIKTGKINIEIDFSDSGEPKMSLKEWKNNELNMLLMKKWGMLSEGTAQEAADEKKPKKDDDATPDVLPDEVQAAIDASSSEPKTRPDADAGGLKSGGGGDDVVSVGELGSAGAGKGGTVTKPKTKLKKPGSADTDADTDADTKKVDEQLRRWAQLASIPAGYQAFTGRLTEAPKIEAGDDPWGVEKYKKKQEKEDAIKGLGLGGQDAGELSKKIDVWAGPAAGSDDLGAKVGRATELGDDGGLEPEGLESRDDPGAADMGGIEGAGGGGEGGQLPPRKPKDLKVKDTKIPSREDLKSEAAGRGGGRGRPPWMPPEPAPPRRPHPDEPPGEFELPPIQEPITGPERPRPEGTPIPEPITGPAKPPWKPPKRKPEAREEQITVREAREIAGRIIARVLKEGR